MLRKLAFLWVWSAASAAYAGQNVVVVLDDSGSMNERMRGNRRQSKMEAAKEALLTVLTGSELPADTQIGILLLNGRWRSDRWVYPLGPLDLDRATRSVRGIQAGGGTPLGECMKEGADALLALREQQRYGSYRLLIVTDGEANDPELVEAYLPDIHSRGIWVDVIGVRMAEDHSLATEVETYREAANPADLEKAIADVLAESTADSSHAGQSDFELIAPLPDEVATAALMALGETHNDPVGQKPAAIPEGQPGSVAAGQPGPAAPRRPIRAPVQTPARGCLGCAGFAIGAFCLVAVLSILLAVGRRPKRF